MYIGSMQTAFDVLAEPTRRRILDDVRDGERSVGELVERLHVSQPGVSKHLRVLREAGPRRRPAGRPAAPVPGPPGAARRDRRVARALPPAVDQRFDALERHLDEVARKEKEDER